jgi:addiction module HigA family antidote
LRPIHPGEIFREDFLVPLEMSANALAMALHVPAPRIPRFSFEQLAAQEMAMSAQQPR